MADKYGLFLWFIYGIFMDYLSKCQASRNLLEVLDLAWSRMLKVSHLGLWLSLSTLCCEIEEFLLCLPNAGWCSWSNWHSGNFK